MALSKAAQEIERELAEYEERRKVRQTPPWMPNPGDKFKAEVIGLRVGGVDSEFGTYPIIVYRNALNGETFAVHAFHTTLREKYKEFADGEPKQLIGQEHFVSYAGKQTSRKRKDSAGNPQEYHLYDAEQVGKETTTIEENFAF